MKRENSFSVLTPSAVRKTLHYRKLFSRARPFRHIQIPRPFSPQNFKKLQHHLKKEPFKKLKGNVFSAQAAEWPDFKNPFVKRWTQTFLREVLPWTAKITGFQ